MSRLLRSALLGLSFGLWAAAVGLGASALLRVRTDCAPLSAEECALERQLDSELGRLQALAALGCVLLATGLYVRVRQKPTD